MSSNATDPPQVRKHTGSAVAICLASAIAGGIAFEIFATHIVRQLGDVCPWYAPQHGHPVRVGAEIAIGAGLMALFGMLLRRTHLPWWALLVAATLTAGAVGALAGLSWFLIGDCLG